MIHHGVLFAHVVFQNIPFHYDNILIKLNSEAEELAFIYLKHDKHHNDVIFIKNFLKSWSRVVKKKMTKIELCDFSNFKNCALSRGYDNEDKFKYVIENGKELRISPYIEPASIFIGRGEHPLRGTVKRRLKRSDIIINISRNAIKNVGIGWKQIVHIKAPWIAKYHDVLTNEIKYIMPNVSSFKTKTDVNKYDKARLLGKRITNIRNLNVENLNGNNTIKQCALCTIIIDKLCIRVGNEKDDDTADTVGCCTLCVKHVSLKDTGHVIFSFLGKDSIRWHKQLKHEEVFKYCKSRLQYFKSDDPLFTISAQTLNSYLNTLLAGLTAKCFRTCHASRTMFLYLKNCNTLKEAKEANLKVAKLLCHKRKDNYYCDTSKANYIDPRVYIAWTKKQNFKLEDIYSTTLLEKFKWARSTPSDFVY